VQVSALGCVEILVVDDGSDPPLVEGLEVGLDGGCLEVIRNDRVMGRAAARNAGVRRARGDVIIFMDSDMSAHPDFIARHLEVHRARKGVAVVGHVDWTGTSTLDRYLESRGVKKVREGDEIPWRYFASGNASILRSDFEKAGPFYEGLKAWGGEDTLLGYDLEVHGISLVYLKEAVTYHHGRIRLDDLCERNYAFGRCSLPLMVSKRPGISREMRVHYLSRPGDGEAGVVERWVKRLFVRGLLRFPGHLAVKAVLPLTWKWLSYYCYDYLVYSSILRGYRDFLRDEVEASVDGKELGIERTAARHGGEGR